MQRPSERRRRSSEMVARTPDVQDFSTVEGAVDVAQFYLHRVGNLAGMCMTDHLEDQDGVVKDMHDIIGALGAVQSALSLVRILHQKLKDATPAPDGQES